MKYIPFLLFILFSNFSLSQDTIQTGTKFNNRNSVQIEFLGIGGLYSINYECIILNQNRFKTTGQIGVSFFDTKPWWGFAFPFSITEIVSFDQNHLEFGLGATPNIVSHIKDGQEWDYFLSGRIGYRYQKPSDRFLFRIGYTPVIYPSFGHWAGIAFGYNF